VTCIAITSGAKGGTGKTTFAAVAAYVWRSLGVPVRVAKTASAAGFYLVDLPAFRLDDKLFVKILSKCKALIYVVDEDFETLGSVERLHAAVKGDVYGVILNKVFRKPGEVFVKAYKRFGDVYVVPFDEKLAVHRAVGIPPFRVKSPATLAMAEAAVDLLLKNKF